MIWTDISPPVRAPKSIIRDRIRSMWVDFSRSRILYAFKLTLAVNLALAAGIYCTGDVVSSPPSLSHPFLSSPSGSGMWAVVAVCMVGPRSLMEVGGSFRAAKLRLSGTGAGAIFGAVVMILVHSVTLEMSHFLLILPWVFVMGYLRHNVSIAYGALIAQVKLRAPNCPAPQLSRLPPPLGLFLSLPLELALTIPWSITSQF